LHSTDIDLDEDSDSLKKKDEEFVLDEIAWKKVKGDVFRRPKCSMLFSILIGTGVQIFAMVFSLLVFALLGIISPTFRGAIITFLYCFFIILSNLSGYYSARFYKMF
jgi:transmembrane 9 superfamily protein 2/4